MPKTPFNIRRDLGRPLTPEELDYNFKLARELSGYIGFDMNDIILAISVELAKSGTLTNQFITDYLTKYHPARIFEGEVLPVNGQAIFGNLTLDLQNYEQHPTCFITIPANSRIGITTTWGEGRASLRAMLVCGNATDYHTIGAIGSFPTASQFIDVSSECFLIAIISGAQTTLTIEPIV